MRLELFCSCRCSDWPWRPNLDADVRVATIWSGSSLYRVQILSFGYLLSCERHLDNARIIGDRAVKKLFIIRRPLGRA